MTRFYLHQVTNALPFFGQLSSCGQQYVFKRNNAKILSLALSAYFFGFNGITAIDQEESMYGNSSLRIILEKYFPNHLDLQPFTYDSFFTSPWATSVEAEEKHKAGEKRLAILFYRQISIVLEDYGQHWGRFEGSGFQLLHCSTHVNHV